MKEYTIRSVRENSEMEIDKLKLSKVGISDYFSENPIEEIGDIDDLKSCVRNKLFQLVSPSGQWIFCLHLYARV